ncbi:MAG: recombinase family protein [Alphaproteobacteria bacterium]|nr:recombinase family protein [Alphaproteobacteria bacterium]
MRTAIYARFSSTLQSDRSIDDQVALCRERAEREGWIVVDVFADLRAALADATAQRDAARAALAEADAAPALALHPNVAQRYRSQVADLSAAFSKADDASRLAAIPALRDLVDRIVMTPRADGRGADIEVTGRLSAMIALATGAPPLPERIVSRRGVIDGAG